MEETCPNCGAVRPSWHGGSHVRKCLKHAVEHSVCCDGCDPDEVWRNVHIPFAGRPRHWAVL